MSISFRKFFEGNKSEIEQMVGNAVPVKLAAYVAQAITAYRCDKKGGKRGFTSTG